MSKESPFARLFVLREEPGFVISKVLAATCVGLILLVWLLVTRGEPEQRIVAIAILPSPGEVFGSLMGLIEDRNLITNTLATMRRVILGFGLAVVLAIPLAILAASFRGLQAFLSPIVVFFRNTPMATLVPLSLAWFGASEKQKVMFIFLATFSFVFADAVTAILAIPKRYIETAETLGANKWQIIRKVLAPLALPEITSSLRVLFGLGFGYIILAEVVDQKTGLGALIEILRRRGEMAEVYMVVVVIVVIAYLMDRGLHFFQKGIFPYRQDL